MRVRGGLLFMLVSSVRIGPQWFTNPHCVGLPVVWFTNPHCNGLPRNWLVFNPLSFCRVLIFSVFRNFDGSESGLPSQHLLLTLKQNHNYVVQGVSTFEILKCGHLDESN